MFVFVAKLCRVLMCVCWWCVLSVDLFRACCSSSLLLLVLMCFLLGLLGLFVVLFVLFVCVLRCCFWFVLLCLLVSFAVVVVFFGLFVPRVGVLAVFALCLYNGCAYSVLCLFCCVLSVVFLRVCCVCLSLFIVFCLLLCALFVVFVVNVCVCRVFIVCDACCFGYRACCFGWFCLLLFFVFVIR